jgi:hypothetical protein
VGPLLFRLRCRVRSHWKSVVALALVIAVMGGVVLTLVAGAVRTLTASDRYADARGRPFDASVVQADGVPRTDELRSLPAVESAVSATYVFGLLGPVGSPPNLEFESFGAAVFAGSLAAFGTDLVTGREADPAVPSEFVASKAFAEHYRATVGSSFDLWVIPSGPARQSGYDAADRIQKVFTATMVGIASGPAELQEDIASAAFPPSLLTAADVGISSTISNVALAPGTTVTDLRQQLDGLADGSLFSIEPADWVPTVVRDAVTTQGQGLAVLAAIAAVATLVVMGQLLSRQFRLSDSERLVLASMGMDRRQIAVDPLLAAATPTALGTVVAVVGAYLASGIFPTGFSAAVEPDPGRRFETTALLPGAVALLVLVLAWVLVAVVTAPQRRLPARRVTVVDATARRLPAPLAMALRFAFVREARDTSGSRTAIVGMGVVVGVLVGALTFGASLGDLISRPARWGNVFDVGAGQSGGTELPDGTVDVLRADPDIAGLAWLASVTTSVGAEEFDVTAVDTIEGSTATAIFDGRLPLGPDELAIGRLDADRFDVGVGDALELVGPDGPRTLRITGIGVMPGGDGSEGVGVDGLMTFRGLRALDPSVVPYGIGIRLRDGASLRGASERLSAATGLGIGPAGQPNVIVNANRIRNIPYYVAAILGVLSLLSLGHQLILSTQRRRRDLAVLRALGADSRWVTGVVHWQASLFTLLVLVIGMPLGIVLGRVVYRAWVHHIGAVDAVSLPYGYLAAALGGMVALANVVATPNARHARRQSPSGLLAEE